MKIHFLMHESFETPGAIEIWAKQQGNTIMLPLTVCFLSL